MDDLTAWHRGSVSNAPHLPHDAACEADGLQHTAWHFQAMGIDFRLMETMISDVKPATSGGEVLQADAVRSVTRAFNLLTLFTPEHPQATLTELAQRSDLALSTVSRLLATLESLQLVRRLESGAWGLGVRVLQLGAAARQTFDLIGIAEPVLEKLNRASGENTNLAVRLDADSFTYIRQFMSRHPVRHATWVGKTQPLQGTANGAVLLGHTPPHGYVATRKTIEPEISAIAAPIYGPGRDVLGSLSITAPTYRMSERNMSRYAKLLVEAAGRISNALQPATGRRHA
jgi:IclR family acetate operon transcriptional repressor